MTVVQASAATDTISGCQPGPTCAPTNTPTTTPTSTPTLSFPMMALLGLILAGAGLFLARRQ